MKVFLIILSVFFTMVAAGQAEYPDSGFTNKAEAKNLTINGAKEGKWVEYDTITHDVIEHYTLTVYKANTAFGFQRTFYLSGKLLSSCPYTDGKKNGAEEIYYEDGNLDRRTIYKNGEPKLTSVYDYLPPDSLLKQ